MSIVRTFNGATILKPGAYTKIVVENLTGFPLQATGVVGIVGEAKGGRPGVLDILSKDNIQSAKARYKSGPIADALELLVNPSKDPRIANGASKIVVYKTNNSTQSSAMLVNGAAANKIALTSANYGADENYINAAVAMGSIADADASITGSVAGPYTLSGSETLILKVNGVSYTFTNGLTGSQTAAAMVGELNDSTNWAPSKPVVASVSGTMVKIAVDSAALPSAAKDMGAMSVDAASTLDTIVGLIGSARGKKGSRVVTFKKDLLTEQMLESGGAGQISVKYAGSGSACSLSIQEVSNVLTLTTTCAGASGDDLSIALETVSQGPTLTLGQLCDLMNAGGKYVASVVGPSASANGLILDHISGLEIKDVAGQLNSDDHAIISVINSTSSLVRAAKVNNAVGELAVTPSPVFLAGASDGLSANSDFANGFDALKEERVNVVVPLISKDIGSLTIDSINALAANHAAWGWSTTGRSERHVFASKLAAKDQLKAASRVLNSGFVSLVGQSVTVLDRQGNLVSQDPWAFACVCAGLRAGAEVGEPLTFKNINVNNIVVADASWNPRKDYNEMIDAGVLIAEPVDAGGFRIVLGNTTYGIDPSFVWNRESVVQAAGYVAYDLRFNLELTFTGTKARTGSAEAMANFIKARMTAYLGADIIVGDDLNEGLGYKSLSVQIQGNAAIINVSVTPVQGIDFILPTIYLADIQQSA